jgi:hypothetical protein
MVFAATIIWDLSSWAVRMLIARSTRSLSMRITVGTFGVVRTFVSAVQRGRRGES